MPDNDPQNPNESESISLADAGSEKRQPSDRATRAAPRPATYYDTLEEQISEERKAMGPPLQDAATTTSDETQARADQADEKPVDPA